SVRLAPSAAAELDRRPGAPRLAAGGGPFATLASGLGLTLEPEFPAPAPSHARAPVATQALAAEAEARLARHVLVHLPPGLTPARAVELLRGLPDVESAEPVHLMPVESVPNDSLWSKSYYFFRAPARRDAHAPEAWDLSTGDSTDAIAIIDTGVLLTHPDLAGPGPGIGGNIWTNHAEASGVPG